MIDNGSRLYSINEIKKMINHDMTDDFISYLCRAPEKVITILDAWRDKSLEPIEQIIEKHQAEKKEELKSDNSVVGSEEIELCLDKDEIQNEDHEIIAENPYSEMEFGDRLKVDKIYAYIVDDLVCRNDLHKIRKIQIVAKKINGGLFGVMMDCCDKCKKLYILRESVSDKIKLFENKQIEFEIKEIK